MKKFKINKLNIINIIIIMLTILIITYIAINSQIIKDILGIKIKQENEEIKVLPLFSYIVYDNQDEENIKVLISINSENGIEYIEKPDGSKIFGNEKNQIKIDYITKKEEENIFKIKEKEKNEQEKILYIDNAAIEESTIGINTITDKTGYEVIELNNKIELEGYEILYKIGLGENSNWMSGTKFSIVDYDLVENGLINDDNTVTISIKAENTKLGNKVIYNENIPINSEANPIVKSIQSESLLNAIEENNFTNGKYEIIVNGETYNTKIYNFDEDITITADTTFGTEKDVATSTEEYAKNMVVLKVNGDLTIDKGAILTAYTSKDGYGGPKGMMIYCTGTLTNNGTISMTARGAYAEGQNVYLWKNTDSSYEYVPAVGASGGDSFTINYSSKNGNNGKNGINRSLGGGGTGAANAYTSTITIYEGGAATSYSGGSGQGAQVAVMNGTKASNIGGTGGSFTTYGNNSVGGGAGNPGGQGYKNSTVMSDYKGSDGTGGLLTIYANNFINNASITSEGSTGGITGYGGGSSGGGSINIFYRELYENTGDYSAKGGASVGGRYKSGAGGTGTITVGSIKTGDYENINVDGTYKIIEQEENINEKNQ